MNRNTLDPGQISHRQRLFEFQERSFSWLGTVFVVRRGPVPAQRGELFLQFGGRVIGHEEEGWGDEGVVVGLEAG
jgi:hypothetical protein